MFYKGEIEQLNEVVVSDPSYKDGVWCRYESDKVDSGGPWRVQMAINDVTDNCDGFEIKGVDFALLLSSSLIFEKTCQLNKDGQGFSCPQMLEMKKTEIGMDTACVALGINEVADEIKASIDEWQPACAFKTSTDGFFGEVYEGSHEGKAYLLYITGYLDEDTGYSVEDVVSYLSENFQIKNLELVKDELGLDEKIDAANDNKQNVSDSKDKGSNELEKDF